MNKRERVKMVKAMEFIARQLNDENILNTWLTLGVADGDVNYGDLTETDDGDLEVYFDDDNNFADLMDVFLYCMRRAANSGGLYCDEVCSAEEDKSDV